MDTLSQREPPRIAEQSAGWKHLFNSYPFPVIWCGRNGEVLRINPIGQRLFGSAQGLNLRNLDASGGGALLDEKLAVALVEGACAFFAPVKLRESEPIGGRWSLRSLNTCQGAIVQVVISCNVPSAADPELLKESGMWGTLAAERSAQLGKAKKRLKLEFAQRAHTEQELNQTSDELEMTREELQEKDTHLVQADKMVNLGQMAAGITHDLNNPLTYVTCNIHTLGHHLELLTKALKAYQELVRHLDVGKDFAPQLEKVHRVEQEEDIAFLMSDAPHLIADCAAGTARVAEIVQNLQGFARKDESGCVLVDLHETCEEALRIAAHEIKAHCEVDRDYGDIPKISCHNGQICQVLVNLMVNAAQSMVERGTLTVRTACLGDFIEIRIQDTGSGISPDKLEHIFQPFYTTKGPNEGTGLGLYVSREIAEKHGGSLEVSSQLGEGTTFVLKLPKVGACVLGN